MSGRKRTGPVAVYTRWSREVAPASPSRTQSYSGNYDNEGRVTTPTAVIHATTHELALDEKNDWTLEVAAPPSPPSMLTSPEEHGGVHLGRNDSSSIDDSLGNLSDGSKRRRVSETRGAHVFEVTHLQPPECPSSDVSLRLFILFMV